MIIDPHVHLGHDTTFDSNRTEDEILAKMDEVGISAAIVQPAQFVTMNDYRIAHDRIYDFHLKHPKRIFGMFSANPHFDKDEYIKEATRCVKDLGFVGMKVTPLTHAFNAFVNRGSLPFEVASELNVTLMLHTGNGLPYALPSTFYERIKEFSKLKIVIAHCGTLENENGCLFLAKECPNVYLECSVRQSNMMNIRRFIDEIGSERVMYASDSPDEMAHVVWMFRNIGLTDQQFEDCLWKTAARAFRLEGRM